MFNEIFKHMNDAIDAVAATEPVGDNPADFYYNVYNVDGTPDFGLDYSSLSAAKVNMGMQDDYIGTIRLTVYEGRLVSVSLT